MGSYKFSVEPVVVATVKTTNREIRTAIPCPGTKALLAELEKVESRSMQGQMPLIWERASGHQIYDRAGNKWIDFTSTIFVTNVGHANQVVCKALREVLEQPLLHTYAYVNRYRIEYIKKLIEFGNGHFQKAFLLSSGTEATEAAIKLMRLQGQKKNKRKNKIICIEGNWHGRTMGAQMLCNNEAQKAWLGFQDPNVHFLPFPYEWVLKGMEPEDFFLTSMRRLNGQGINPATDICGFMLETFQGWGAVFYPESYVQAIAQFCKDNGILLVFDEMQAGFGRTGKNFGYQHYHVQPDLICCGKGMASGVPLSGVLGSAEIMDLPEVGNMSSTHSANPLVCAAGLATLNELNDKNLIPETARKGEVFLQRLLQLQAKYPEHIAYVYGKGLLAALLFRDPETGQFDKEIGSILAEKCMQKGLLLVHTGRESIKLAPPLTISDAALLEGLSVLDDVCSEIFRYAD